MARFSPRGEHIVAICGSGSKGYLLTRDGKHTRPLDIGGAAMAVDFFADGRFVTGAISAGHFRSWTADGRFEAELPCQHPQVYSIDLHPDGKRALTSGLDGALRVFDLDRVEAAPLVFRHQIGRLRSASWSPTGRRMVSASLDDTVLVASENGDPLWQVRVPGCGWHAEFWTGGDRLLVASWNRTGHVLPGRSSIIREVADRLLYRPLTASEKVRYASLLGHPSR